MNTLFSPLQEFWKKGDKLLLLLCLLASVYGVALIFSATRYNGNNRAVITQCVAILLGAVIYILCTFIDFQLFVEKNWKLVFGVSVLFILLLLTPLGSNVGGNRNWLDIPYFPINIQPNEIDKIPFILLLALLITKIQDQGRDIGSVLSVLQIGAYAAFTVAQVAAMGGGGEYTVYYSVPQALGEGTLQFDKIARSVNGGKWNTWAMPSSTGADAGSGWWTKDGDNYYFKWGAVFAQQAEDAYQMKDGGVFDYTIAFLSNDGSQDNVVATCTFRIDLSGYPITADE